MVTHLLCSSLDFPVLHLHQKHQSHTWCKARSKSECQLKDPQSSLDSEKSPSHLSREGMRQNKTKQKHIGKSFYIGETSNSWCNESVAQSSILVENFRKQQMTKREDTNH